MIYFDQILKKKITGPLSNCLTYSKKYKVLCLFFCYLNMESNKQKKKVHVNKFNLYILIALKFCSCGLSNKEWVETIG